MAKTNERDFQAEIRDSAHKIWLAGLGALALAEEEGGKFFRRLVDRGEKLESRGKDQFAKARTKVESAWEGVEGTFDDQVSSVLHRLGVPTRDEIRTLTKRIEDLSAKVDQLKPKAAAKKTA